VKRVGIPSDADAVRDHIVTAEEEKAYFAACLSKFEIELEDGTKEKHGPFPALHDVARIILDQGMRPDERGTIRVMQGKTKSARRVLVMTPAVKAIMVKRVDGRTEGWVFKGNNPTGHLTKLNNPHNAVLKKIGADFVMYEFRHTFATRFGEAVGDPIALATILGHANLKMVMRYCHPQDSHTAKAMQTYIGSLEVLSLKADVGAGVAVN
jgi:integrase